MPYPQSVLGNPDIIFPNSPIYGWRDITGQVLVRGVAATDPTWAQIGTSVFSAYRFAIDDYVWFVWHIPHDIVPNREIHFHAHWLTNGTSTNAVTWEWIFTYAKGFNQQNFNMTGTTITATQAAAGTAFRHMVTETAGVAISGLSEPDGIIYARLRRVANASGADNADGVFMLTSDVHYQTTSMATPNKAPDFYKYAP